MKLKSVSIFSLFFVFASAVSAQKNNKNKFEDVTPADFATSIYSLDSNANAIVLKDAGKSTFEGGGKGDFELHFNHHKRMRILNKSAFDEATIELYFYYSNNTEERIEDWQATTYNLVNGQVVATKLDKSALLKEKYNDHYNVRKFTFPNVKEGSIIEYSYTIISPFYTHLQPWNFQSDIPALWSEYEVTIPNDIFDYVLIKQGYLPYAVDTSSTGYGHYSISTSSISTTERSETFNLNSATITAKWAIKDVPALKAQSFITSLENYRSRIEFQLKRIKYSESNIEEYMSDWYKTTERLNKREDFGMAITANNGFLADDLKRVTLGAKDDYTKAKKVYEYVRDNYNCTDYSAIFVSTTLKKVYDTKSGSVADLNLLLVAALKRLNFEAAPALLSTRNNGFSNEVYPLLNKFNYVICRVKIGDQYYLLDASESRLGFGKLPRRDINNSARVIDTYPALVELSSDSITEVKMTSVFAINDGKKISASVSTQYGNFESMDMRELFYKTKPEAYLEDLKKSFTIEPELSNIEIDSLKIYEEPITVKYDMNFGFNDEDIIYFNPILADAEKTNPFTAANRYYPVEMLSREDKTYVLNMEIPAGYKIDEIPKSARIKLNEDEGMFEYIIAASSTQIQLRCRLVLNKALFEPEDYETLREFYTFVVQKQAEQIVFKKIQ